MWFLEKVNNICNTLAWLINKRENTNYSHQECHFRYSTNLKKIIRQYYDIFYPNTFHNLEVLENFLENSNCQKERKKEENI